MQDYPGYPQSGYPGSQPGYPGAPQPGFVPPPTGPYASTHPGESTPFSDRSGLCTLYFTGLS